MLTDQSTSSHATPHDHLIINTLGFPLSITLFLMLSESLYGGFKSRLSQSQHNKTTPEFSTISFQPHNGVFW